MTTETESPDLALVQDEINRIIAEPLDLVVRLLPVGSGNPNQTYGAMLASNEKIDLMMVMGGIGQYVERKQIIQLDQLVEERGQDIIAAEGMAMNGGYYAGDLYAVPSEERMGRSYGIMARSDLLEQYHIDTASIQSYKDLDAIFQTLLEHHPDLIPFACLQSVCNMFLEIDTLGASLASGCLMDGGQGEPTVVNLFATEEYRELVYTMYEWNQKGYLLKNAVTKSESSGSLVEQGLAFSYPMQTGPGMEGNASSNRGFPMTAIPLTKDYATTSMYQLTMWVIPATCQNPEKAMEFLNFTYADEEIVNLLSNGIKGMHYVTTEHPRIIRRPEGITAQNTGYRMIVGVYGDKMLKYAWEPSDPDIFDQMTQYNADVLANGASQALGYVFDPTGYKAQITNISGIIDEYQEALETGCVNPEMILPQFLSRLEAAGIDAIIQENQRQLDAWLKEQTN